MVSLPRINFTLVKGTRGVPPVGWGRGYSASPALVHGPLTLHARGRDGLAGGQVRPRPLRSSSEVLVLKNWSKSVVPRTPDLDHRAP